MNTNTSTLEDAERILAAAGIPATLVANCSDDQCVWCERDQMLLAA